MKPKELILDINGKDYKVIINNFSAFEAEVSVNGTPYKIGLKNLGLEDVADVKPVVAAPSPQVSLHKDTSGAKTPVHRPKNIGSANQIISPLPGLITKLLVHEGDDIKKGQAVAVIEAMKMENEINSTVSGTIIDVRFKEGASVNQGDVLFFLKPAEA